MFYSYRRRVRGSVLLPINKQQGRCIINGTCSIQWDILTVWPFCVTNPVRGEINKAPRPTNANELSGTAAAARLTLRHNQGNGRWDGFRHTAGCVISGSMSPGTKRSRPLSKLWGKIGKELIKYSDHVGGGIDSLRDVLICASSLCCCALMEKALMQTEGGERSLCPDAAGKYRSACFC